MSELDVDREYIAWCADMRFRGAHPDWFVIWLGANNIDGRFFTLVNGDHGWPVEIHKKKPDMDNGVVADAYKRGLPKWQAMLQRLNPEQGDQP